MGLERKLGLLFSTGLLSILSCAGEDTGNNSPTEKPVPGCVADYECKGERVCIEGKCIDNTKPNGNPDTVSSPDTKTVLPDTIAPKLDTYLDTSKYEDTSTFQDFFIGESSSFPDASCTPKVYSGCHQGDVWWFDSCDQPHKLKQSCDYGCEENWDEGFCKDAPEDVINGDVLIMGDILFQETGSGCFGDEYACNDGKCIYSNWVCDGEADCSKGEDEKGCSIPQDTQDTYTPPSPDTSNGCNEYTCLNGECIPDSWLCDGVNDCSKGEDEQNCAPSCTDECYQSVCLDSNLYAFCDDYNGDGCLEWSGAKSCGVGWYCVNEGECTPEDPNNCKDECDNIYVKMCFDNKLFPCVTDYDSDNCLEWGEPSNCGPGQYCNDGDKVCKSKPTDPDAGP